MNWKLILCGICAGAVNGLLGTGGGMLLVPLLGSLVKLPDDQIFPASLSIILPISLVSVLIALLRTAPDWPVFLPYLAGGAAGGILAGRFGQKIPLVWLHRTLGALILWGGIRNLCF